jgi:tetratricopeptide (TPR) repeat protein
MTRTLLFTLAICLACVAASARVAYADADDTGTRTAKRHYNRGQKLFALQKFDAALEQFQKAFDARQSPEFLFNIGQCHRNLGDYEAAIFSFKRYLKLDPDAPNREKVEELIEELEEKQAAGESKKRRLSKDPDEDRPPPPAAGSPFYKKWWFWTGVAVVGVGGGVGIYAATSGGAGPPDTTLGRNIVFGK